jgi:hypothetical protein
MNTYSTKSIAAIMYPDKIIIVTKYSKDEFVSYLGDIISILNVDVSNEELGKAVLDHLEKSVRKDFTLEEIKKLNDSYKRLTKFKSENAAMIDAKYVSVTMKGGLVIIEPFSNKISNRTYYRLPREIKETKDIDIGNIGIELRLAWNKCLFID